MELKGTDVIRGKILSRYLTLTRYAKCLGWTRQKLSDTLRQQRIPTLDDVSCMAETLDMPIDDIVEIFLAKPSTNVDREGS